MKKIFLAILLSFVFVKATSQEKEIPQAKSQRGFLAFDFLSINMPEDPRIINEPNMGFAGIHYNLNFNNFYSGIGIYGSISGVRGGFFTLGINAGYKYFLNEKLFLDTGFHFGAGGGAAAADGGGAFILPHLNLGYQFKDFSLTGGYSYINFFDGGLIKGSQFNVGVQFPLDFNYAAHEHLEQRFTTNKLSNSEWNKEANAISVMLHLNNLNVLSKANATTGEVLNGKTIRLAGFELSKFASENLFYFLKVDGAYSGIRAGYMDIFLGGGYRFSFNKKRTHLLSKFAIGAGGGGGVDTNGGFMIAPDISIEQQVFKNIFLALNAGYMLTPDSKFKTATYGAGLKYNANLNGIYNRDAQFESAIFKGVAISLLQDLYVDAKRDTNPTENLYQLSLQINLNISKNLYVAGQTSFANFGNAGAYAEGLVGVGLNSNPLLNQKITLFSQFLAGGAGGGNINTGQGFIIKPSAGIELDISKRFGFKTSLGYVKAIGAALSSPFINMGLTYRISFLQAN